MSARTTALAASTRVCADCALILFVFCAVCTALTKAPSWLIACLLEPAWIEASTWSSLSVRLATRPAVSCRLGLASRLIRRVVAAAGLGAPVLQVPGMLKFSARSPWIVGSQQAITPWSCTAGEPLKMRLTVDTPPLFGNPVLRTKRHWLIWPLASVSTSAKKPPIASGIVTV